MVSIKLANSFTFSLACAFPLGLKNCNISGPVYRYLLVSAVTNLSASSACSVGYKAPSVI